jgi:C4-dicarboxylate transporter DctM subunit
VLIVLLIILAVLAVGGAVAFAFGAASVVGLLQLGSPIASIPSMAYRGIDTFPIMAIPFFLLTGALMKDGGISRRLIDFVAVFTGRVRGGMGVTLVGTSAIFGAISGSSVATVSAMGAILSPEMRRRGYPAEYLGGLTGVSGMLGIMIPPSIPMIVFGIATGVSIGELFLAGMSAGILLAVLFSIINVVLVRTRYPDVDDLGDPDADPDAALNVEPDSHGASGVAAAETHGTTRTRARPRPRIGLGRRTVVTAPALALPFIILGGIYGGVFTPTEAGAVACVYALLIAMLVYRSLSPRQAVSATLEAGLQTASLLIILALGTVFSRYLTMARVPTALGGWVTENAGSLLLFLVLANVVMLLVGTFIEENTAIIILAPLLTPIATTFGMDPVHFGVIMVLNLGIGLSTPPMAPNLFVAARACATPFHRMLPTTGRFLLWGAVPVLLLVNLVPEFVLYLPGFLD